MRYELKKKIVNYLYGNHPIFFRSIVLFKKKTIRVASYFFSGKFSKAFESFGKSPGWKARRDFFEAAMMFLQVNRMSGSYLEFGCHEANTFRLAFDTLGDSNSPIEISQFWAFDSFQGMPEPKGIDKQKIWAKNLNSTDRKTFEYLTSRAKLKRHIVEGYYEETLTGKSYSIDAPCLIYIDCDYYDSTRVVLNFIKSHLRHGCIIVFDDWDCYYADPCRGQRLAFREFSDSLGGRWGFEPFYRLSSGGIAFIIHDQTLLGEAFE